MKRGAYEKDKKNHQELEPTFYTGLGKKIDLYKKSSETNKVEVQAKFRNNMARPRTKARIIARKTEILGLYLTLIGIDNFLSP